jgi:hypothetical protein
MSCLGRFGLWIEDPIACTSVLFFFPLKRRSTNTSSAVWLSHKLSTDLTNTKCTLFLGYPRMVWLLKLEPFLKHHRLWTIYPCTLEYVGFTSEKIELPKMEERLVRLQEGHVYLQSTNLCCQR